MTTVQPLSVSEDTDSIEVGKLPHSSLADTDESVSKESIVIRENLKKNREAILRSLDPLYPPLYKLLDHYELAEEFTNGTEKNRRKMAERLLSKIEQSGDYRQFLDCLEEDYDDEHTGHTYIVSLLNGKQFGKKEVEKHIESEKIMKSTTQKGGFVIDQLDPKSLLPYLKVYKLVTSNEEEEMLLEGKTRRDKAMRLLAILKTKGPTAHHVFLHDCLAGKDANHIHLYTLLTESDSPYTRKRKTFAHSSIAPPTKAQRVTSVQSAISAPPTTLLWSQLRLLQLPKGITQECYITKISGIRQNFSTAMNSLQAEMNSPDNSREARIAFCLEKCFFYVNNIKETERIVSQARKMNLAGSNSQVLESRCELVLGRCYTKCKKYDQAKKCLNNAHTTLSTFEPGEDAILANCFIACSLSTDQRDMITTFLQKVICLSEQENYGMDIAQYCKIRLAQMYIGVSPDNPDSYKGDISQDDLKRCNNLLEHIEAKHKDMQPAAKCLYLIAYSDVYRLAGKFDEAREYTKQAEKTAMSKYHISLVEKRQFLLQ